MSMTQEQALKLLEHPIYKWSMDWDEREDGLNYTEAIEIAIAALRPVSREQVEMVWFGCDICRGDKEVKSDNFCGAATMRIVGDSIDLRGDKKKIKFFGHIYAPNFSVRFCPFCGKPLTDEAVEIRLKELEALNDGESD